MHALPHHTSHSPAWRNPLFQPSMASWLRPLAITVCLLTSTVSQAEDNPYASHYQAQNQGNLHSMQAQIEPQLMSGQQRDSDNIRMLEDGYDLMGFSQFEAGDISPDLAVAHGRAILADRILVYVKKGGKASPGARMEVIKEAVKKGQSLTEKDMAEIPVNYRYYASFWAKLPPPVLGIHVIKLVPKTDRQAADLETLQAAEGVRIIAVIHQSAAEKAGLIRGDQLLTIQKEKVVDAAGLSSLVRRWRGQAVDVEIVRNGETLHLPVQL